MALLIRPAIPAWRLLNIVSLGEGEKKTSSVVFLPVFLP
jgi:hypothetical protein